MKMQVVTTEERSKIIGIAWYRTMLRGVSGLNLASNSHSEGLECVAAKQIFICCEFI
jgi:hypothetical protein